MTLTIPHKITLTAPHTILIVLHTKTVLHTMTQTTLHIMTLTVLHTMTLTTLHTMTSTVQKGKMNFIVIRQYKTCKYRKNLFFKQKMEMIGMKFDLLCFQLVWIWGELQAHG